MFARWRVVLPTIAAFVAAGVLGALLVLDDRGDQPVRSVSAPQTSASAPADDGRRELGPGTVAVQDFAYGIPGHAATRDKAQNKLWFHDGSWWATMVDPFSSAVRIFELRDGVWSDTEVLVDPRPRSNADVLWTGTDLFIASRTSSGELLLRRYAYGQDRTWVPTATAPEVIARGGGRSLTIAVDGAGRVWAAWVSEGRLLIAGSGPGGTGFGPPVTPQGGTGLADDEAAAVTAFDGQIGVLWSNQNEDAFLWTSRADDAPAGRWEDTVAVTRGVNFADGHINFAVGSTGDVYAAVKTSLGDDDEPAQSALLEVLHRNPAGEWTANVAATVESQTTRPVLAITDDDRHLLLVATSPQSGGALHYKIAQTADVRFAPGVGSVLLNWEGAVLNDATTTGAPVDPDGTLVVLASDADAGRYYHSELALPEVLPRD